MRTVAWMLVVCGCGAASAPAVAHDPVAAEPAASRCEDTVEGPLYTPETAAGYAVTGSELASRTLRDHLGELRHCYLKRTGALATSGPVTLTLSIDRTGKPQRVRTHGFDAAVDRCICDRLFEITFEPMLSETEVRFPIELPALE